MQVEMLDNGSFIDENWLTEQESDEDSQDDKHSIDSSGDDELFQDDISKANDSHSISSQDVKSENEGNRNITTQRGGHDLCEECRRITLENLTTGQTVEHHLSFRGLTECSRTCDLCLFLLEKITSSADDVPANAPIQLIYRIEHGTSKLRITY